MANWYSFKAEDDKPEQKPSSETKKWTKFSAKILNIVIIFIIIGLGILNFYWITSVASLRIIPNSNPQFYSTDKGIGLNTSFYLMNNNTISTDIKDIEMNIQFQNDSRSVIFEQNVTKFTLKRTENYNLTINLFRAMNMTNPAEIAIFTNMTQIRIVINLKAKMGFYLINIQLNFAIKMGGS